jgi:hypothetical protein
VSRRFSTYRFRGPRTGQLYALTVRRRGEGAPEVVREHALPEVGPDRSLARLPARLEEALGKRVSRL